MQKLRQTLVLPNLTTSTNALREVQRYEERIDEAATVLDLNTTTLTALSGWYSRLIADLKKDKTLSFNVQDAMEQVVEEFVLDVEDHIRETQMQYKQLNILAKLLSDQRTNVSASPNPHFVTLAAVSRDNVPDSR